MVVRLVSIMTFGSLIKRSGVIFLSVLSATAFASPTSTPDAAALQAVLDGQAVSLFNDNGRCVLAPLDRAPLEMDLPWPCQFTVDGQGRSYVETFRNVPIVIVLHVEPATAGAKTCESQYRAVRLINGRLEPSVISHSAACYTGVGDQKDYTGVFAW